MKKIEELDGIRGIAIAAVILVHCSALLPPSMYPVLKLLSPGFMGVNIFFVLSGFLITGILIDSRHNEGYFRNFYARRTLRIFPLYFGTLTVAFVILPLLRLVPVTPISEQLWYWSYLYNWHIIGGSQALGLGHFWSLAIEEQFYFIWPAVVLLAGKRLRSVCIAAITTSFLFRIAVLVLGWSPRIDVFSTPARVEDLCIGALAACVFRDEELLPVVRLRLSFLIAAATAALGITGIIAKGLEVNKLLVEITGTSAISWLTGLVILLALTDENRLVSRVLRTKALCWLGTYSYGLYVLHQPIRDLLQSRHIVGVSGCVALVICSCVCAWLSYRYFETPFLRLKNRFAARPIEEPAFALRQGATAD